MTVYSIWKFQLIISLFHRKTPRSTIGKSCLACVELFEIHLLPFYSGNRDQLIPLNTHSFKSEVHDYSVLLRLNLNKEVIWVFPDPVLFGPLIQSYMSCISCSFSFLFGTLPMYVFLLLLLFCTVVFENLKVKISKQDKNRISNANMFEAFV